MWVRWARLSVVHKIDGLFFKSLALSALLAPQKVWHLPKIWDDRQKVPKVPLTTPQHSIGPKTLAITALRHLKDQYGPRVFFLEFPFFAENMIIRSILNLWWHSEILKLILGVVRGMFTKRLKGTRRLLYTVKSDFFEMTALHSKC